ncbi:MULTISPECIES: tetratricopeptide repeat protein [Aerosakkonema]|uniref:tetratricopeptide repeat protein n=1 Tax=Aerosakkonema TaxID=1246629 RepID=UPI0035B7C4B5
MKKVAYAIAGLLIGILITFLLILIDTIVAINTGIPFGLVTFIGVLAVWGFLIWELYFNSMKPIKLMFQGEYDRALALLHKKLNSIFVRLHIESKNGIIYNIANVYHRMGRFEDASEWLEKIEPRKLDRIVKGPYYGLSALNLLMLKADLNEAERYLEIASTFEKFTLINLIYVYFYVLINNLTNAGEKLQEYLENKENIKNFNISFNTILIRDKEFLSVLENFIYGTYYQAINDRDRARECFEKAYSSPYDSYYQAKAGEWLRENN